MKRHLLIFTFTLLVLGNPIFAAPSQAAEKPPATEIPTALVDYVTRPDPTFAWEIKQRSDGNLGRVYRVELTSQKWQGIVWKHALNIHEPQHIQYPRHVLLFIRSGNNVDLSRGDDIQLGLALANLAGARVAILHQVPNQPLLGNHQEDDLISETWLHYLATGDANWPLLFPMVKSAVRAMDAVEAIAKQQWNGTSTAFVATGMSKRGWTTWLTAAADKRVIAIAPMVIDVLNFRPQMKYQLETWGDFSEMIADYTRKGLIKTGDETSRETELRRMMDPYTYLGRLSLPKLLIHGTNDPYWVVDATQFYWDDMVGEKYVLKVANVGHGLGRSLLSAFHTLSAFFRHAVDGTPLPALQWTRTEHDGELSLRVTSSIAPKAALFWTAHSATADFRNAQWQSDSLAGKDGAFVAAVRKPEHDHLAFFAELLFEMPGLPYSLTTLVWRYE